jgi:serine protease AprX
MFKYLVLFIITYLAPLFIAAQSNMYLVKFTDKNNSPYSLQNPTVFLSQKSIERRFKQGIKIQERDLPPNPAYIDSLNTKSIQLLYKSRWFNAALIIATEEVKNAILNFPFVENVEFNMPLKQNVSSSSFRKKSKLETVNTLNYGDATAQIELLGVNQMHEQGFHGENMLIAVLDNGFLNANSIICLDSIFDNNRVLEIYDFVDNDSTLFSDGGHGTSVLSCMAAYLENELIAPAYMSNYVLFRTEDDDSETRAEEAYWLFAAERADSLGVEIINTSLGYSTFDNPSTNYTTSQMDGNTTLITRAADIAASTGMLIINSAGNSGGTSWNIITAPADGDSVLAVGAVSRTGIVASFSSRGNPANSTVKPDVMAVGYQTALSDKYGQITASNGTSFASPLTAAMAAGLWQANPLLSSFDILTCIRKSGHIYNNPNVDYGYGITHFNRADSIAKNEFKIRNFEPNLNVLSLKLKPDVKAVLEIKINSSLLGHELRFTLVDLGNISIINHEVVMATNSILSLNLEYTLLEHNYLFRIDDMTEAKNLGIFHF